SFPAWFLNLAGVSGRPPDAVVAMTVDGYVSIPTPGELKIGFRNGQRVYGTIDDSPVDETSNTHALGQGVHHVRLWTVLQGDNWTFIPTWNGADLFASVLTTTAAPNAIDRIAWRVSRVAVAALAIALLLAWIVHAALALSPGTPASSWTATAPARLLSSATTRFP